MNTAHQDFDSWFYALRAACGQFDARQSRSASLFRGHINHAEWDTGLQLTSIGTNAEQIRCDSARSARKSAQADDRFCYLVLQKSGQALMTQGDSSFMLGCGEIAFLDAAYGCQITPIGLMEHASIHLERQAVAHILPSGQTRMAKVQAGNPFGRLLYSMVSQICDSAISAQLRMYEGSSIQDALVALLEPALQRCSETGAAHLPAMMGVVKEAIDCLLQDPLLGPEKVAARVGISVRQLYRLFEQEGDSVCRYILRRRLEKIGEALHDPSLQRFTITDIALQWGFSDVSHFSRCFKKQWGVSAKEYRRESITALDLLPH